MEPILDLFNVDTGVSFMNGLLPIVLGEFIMRFWKDGWFGKTATNDASLNQYYREHAEAILPGSSSSYSTWRRFTFTHGLHRFVK